MRRRRLASDGAADPIGGFIDEATATAPAAHDATNEYWAPFTPTDSMTAMLAVQKVARGSWR